MRCPHCGYNSFAHLEHCKKCGREMKLRSIKTENPADHSVAGAASATAKDEDSTSTSSSVTTPSPALFSDFDPSPLRTDGDDKKDRFADVDTSADEAMFSFFSSDSDTAEHDQAEAEPLSVSNLPWESSLQDDASFPQKRALIGRRFLASMLDIAVILAVWLIFYTWGHSLVWEEDAAFFAPLLHSPRARGGFYLLLILIALAYFILFHYINGQTPGKFLTRIKVVSCDAEPLTLNQVMLRTCGGFVSALCLGGGYIAIWWAQDARGWNDRFADTRVEFISAGDTSRAEYE